MQPREGALLDLVRRWTEKADKDFALAEHLAAEGCCYCEAIGFNSQQAAEKYLKALLVFHQVAFPRTHSLGELLDLVHTAQPAIAEYLRDVTALNPYGVEYRYPGDFPDMSQEEALTALGLASKVRDAVVPILRPLLQDPAR